MNNPIIYYVLGFFVLAYIFVEIAKRIKKVPVAILISRQENKQIEVVEKKKVKQVSFAKRAERVSWITGRNYLQYWFVAGTAIGGISGYVFDNIIFLIAGVVVGLFYPYYQLWQKEEMYENELPLVAEQAINAVEQQLTSDVPIFDALKAAIPYMSEPLKSKYEKACEKVEKTGMSLSKAIEKIPEEVGLPQLEYFHIILEVAEETEEKSRDIISDASETLRRQQKQATRLQREVATSKSEMKMMFMLVCVMVVSFIFMLPESIPFTGSTLHRFLDVFSISVSAWVTWTYLKKIHARNIF